MHPPINRRLSHPPLLLFCICCSDVPLTVVPCDAQIARRRNEHQEKYPDAKVISLGIGDTTEPIPEFIAKALADASMGLNTREGYSGWVPSGACST